MCYLSALLQPIGQKRNPMLEIARENALDLSHSAFLERYYDQKIPVVLKAGAAHWRATQLWSPDYFLHFFGEKQTGVFVFEKKEGQWRRSFIDRIPLSQAIAWMQENSDVNRKYYILKESIAENYPELISDFTFPSWGITPLAPFANLWFGQGGNITALHYDTIENFHAQIYGRKQFRLFPPEDTAYLYPHSARTGGRLNFSQIHDLDQDLLESFPLFYKARASLAVLEPGDILYLPPGWWHEVRTLELGISLNFWFNPSRDQGPLWHLLGYLACRVQERLLSTEEAQVLYRWNWANTQESAEYMRMKGHYWLSVLMCAVLLENRKQDTSAFSSLIKQASREDSSLIDPLELDALLLSIESVKATL